MNHEASYPRRRRRERREQREAWYEAVAEEKQQQMEHRELVAMQDARWGIAVRNFIYLINHVLSDLDLYRSFVPLCI